jgi:predicted DNA-binding transcriptional regulator YafY
MQQPVIQAECGERVRSIESTNGRASCKVSVVSRTTRLFKLMDTLRAHRRPVTAARLADDLSVSVRTLYRDIQTLIDLGAPVQGEAGLGYVLRAGFFLPPLMFGEEELEALVLGARWVRGQGDPSLALAADSALAKIATASPKDLRDKMAETGLWVPRFSTPAEHPAGLKSIREALRREYKLAITYVDEAGSSTERVVWPIALAFFEGKRLLAAWCEMRNGFRHFRSDRIMAVNVTRDRYPIRRAVLTKNWRRENDIPDAR